MVFSTLYKNMKNMTWQFGMSVRLSVCLSESVTRDLCQNGKTNHKTSISNGIAVLHCRDIITLRAI